jgi:hypothetical protein
MKRFRHVLAVIGLTLASGSAIACPDRFLVGKLDLTRSSLEDLAAAQAQKKVTSAQLTTAYLERIADCNPELRAVISTNCARRRNATPSARPARCAVRCTACPSSSRTTSISKAP